MDSASKSPFLDLAPLVQSQKRAWTIRSVRSEDIHKVKTLNDRWLGRSFSRSFYLQFLYNSATTCILAEDRNGLIVGCGTAKATIVDCSSNRERECHVLTLAVDPSWRRRGIGRDLLEALVTDIRAICARLATKEGQNIQLTSVVLQTSAQNLAALKFYEVCGYQRQALKPGYYGGRYDAIPMRLSLAEDTGNSRSGGSEITKPTSGRNWSGYILDIGYQFVQSSVLYGITKPNEDKEK